LPVTRDTLLVRLLGAGAVLKQAITELQALPAQAAERRLALPILLELRLAVPSDPAQQTSDDQEFLMSTYPLAEAWRRAAIEEGVQQGLEQGVQQGLEQGERQLLLRQLRRRFGAEVDGAVEGRVATAAVEQIELWADRVLSAATLAEVLAD
jgi:flagellar biosynthesis/type III secretory pathway protein FliH